MIGSHNSKAVSREWLTPPWILKRLGSFDLDPCAMINQPWPTAKIQYTIIQDGLYRRWEGRVWCNPPYNNVDIWLKKLAEYGNGIALTFARTETKYFFRSIWGKVDGILFIKDRLFFYRPDGTKAVHNSGAPSVLLAYGKENAECLQNSHIPGAYIAGHKIIMVETLFKNLEKGKGGGEMRGRRQIPHVGFNKNLKEKNNDLDAGNSKTPCLKIEERESEQDKN